MLADDMIRFATDPLGWVMYAFPWSSDPSIKMVPLQEPYASRYGCEYGPDLWACEWLDDLGLQIALRGFDLSRAVPPIRMAVASGHGIGKAQRLDDVAMTPDGPMRWGDLVAGHRVFAADGRPTTVVGTSRWDHVPMYRVRFDDGSHVDVSSGHLWTVRGRQERRAGHGAWRTMETIEILRAGVKRSNGRAHARQWEIPVQGPMRFKAQDIPLCPYLLGVWLGDGGKGCARFTKPCPEIAERLRAGGHHVTTSDDGLHHYVRHHAGVFHAHEYLQLGSHERYIPDAYKYNTVECRRALFEGLCDTDGEAHQSGSIGYSTTSRRLAEDVLWLARSLGCKARMQPAVRRGWYTGDAGERVECRDCYRLTINSPWNPFTVHHKRDRYKASDERYLKRWIDSIEPIGHHDAMCIAVDADGGLYQTADCHVTHNSTMTAWLILYMMSTRPMCRGTVTANTSPQLESKTWAELGKWLPLCITSHWFELSTGRGNMKLVHRDHASEWRCIAQTCREENTESFAGQHAANSSSFYIFDEASAIPDKIWEVAEGGLTDGEPMIFAFGNPTRNTGNFREAWRKCRNLWRTTTVDSRQAHLTSKSLLQEWIDTYGVDSDFVKIRVRGMFPAQSVCQFISEADVDAAYGRVLRPEQYNWAPVVLGCDPAWMGDDSLVVYKRQGLKAEKLLSMPKNDNDAYVAGQLARLEDEHHADAVFIDQGYGTGIYSCGRQLGRNWILVPFGAASPDPGCHLVRSFIWRELRNWLQSGGSIPEDPVLYQDLIGPELIPRADGKIQLESKPDMKKRGLPSPNDADSLALTLYQIVWKEHQDPTIQAHLAGGERQTVTAGADYDPVEAL
ncbi:MAG: LAGLIDADG family homing endonuclease [Halothiobacillaceae bacterium]